MKDIKPPRKPKTYYYPSPKDKKNSLVIRTVLGLGTILIIYLISKYIK